jgi:hypothetical protein
MKLNGEFVVRQVVDETVVVPVGQTALQFNGMIMLNDVNRVIWESLQQETDLEQIVTAVTDAFEVSREEARTDIVEFLDKLRKIQLLEE